jgi:hypothetical protein
MNTGRIKKLVAIFLAGVFLAGSGAFAAEKCPKGQRWDKKASHCMVMKHHKKKTKKAKKMKKKVAAAAAPASK